MLECLNKQTWTNLWSVIKNFIKLTPSHSILWYDTFMGFDSVFNNFSI